MSIDKYFSDRTRYWNKDTGQATSTNGAYGKEKREVSIFNTQQLLNYNREIGKHSISAMVGHEFNEYNYNNLNELRITLNYIKSRGFNVISVNELLF